MKLPKKWIWQCYSVFFPSVVLGSWHEIYGQDSSLRMYYTILTAFDKHYLIWLSLNILNVLVTALSCLVVFYYAFNIERSRRFWKIMFFLRIILDVLGHHYDLQLIKSAFYQSEAFGFACIGVYVIPLIPSYLAHFLYVFKKNPLPAPSSTPA